MATVRYVIMYGVASSQTPLVHLQPLVYKATLFRGRFSVAAIILKMHPRAPRASSLACDPRATAMRPQLQRARAVAALSTVRVCEASVSPCIGLYI